ncbi:MAG: thioesterase [Lysobacterales bacterium 14-68-21]|nr:MAG: thioesterase [Xanthomonadales bacterium 15-68-25]OZB66717.1 MAG: thioesterase [Xanthomonadales bacterium 14-68-21]
MTTEEGATKRTRKTRSTKTAAAPETTTTVQERPAAPLFVAELDARWRDLDAFNHVNNATYLTYLEEARLQWLRHVPGPWFDEHSMPVLAASQLNYRLPIAWPARLAVALSCERLGNSSITLAHRIVEAAEPERLYCDGHVVLVWMDPHTGKPVPLPQAIRDSVEAASGAA